jgi:hypothetical protein
MITDIEINILITYTRNCGLDYSQLSYCVQNLLFADNSLGYLQIFSQKKGVKPPKQRSLVIPGLGIRTYNMT